MPSKLIQRKKEDPRERLLSEKSVLAIMETWTQKMRDVGEDLSCLPVKPWKNEDERQMNRWGFVFAIDALRGNASAIQALSEALPELMEELKHLPTREEMFQLVDRLLAFKVEVRKSIQNHAAFRQKTKGPIGFVRRR
jgi:hypothetical protein